MANISKADYVMEKHAGVWGKVLGGIGKVVKKGWRKLTGTTTNPTVVRRTGQAVKQKVKEKIVPTIIGAGALGTAMYTGQKRKQARQELTDYRADNTYWDPQNVTDYDKITGSQAFADSLLTTNQMEGLNKMTDLNKRKVQRSGLDNYNVSRFDRSENPQNKEDVDYRANLINQGKMTDEWLNNPNIIRESDKKRAAELALLQTNK